MSTQPITNDVNLRAVDWVEISIIVDNNIEWMSKLPPGFSSEVRLQLANNPPMDAATQTPLLDLDHYCCGAHGLSILIKTHVDGASHYTLFDTGPDARALQRNLEALKIDLSVIDHVALSHWHRDHSGGILEFLKLRNESSVANTANAVIVDVHPSRPFARGIAPPPKFDKVIARLPEDPTFEEMKALGASVVTSKVPHVIQNETVFISGEIPRETAWEKGLLGSVRWFTEEGGEKQGGWVAEPEIIDERYAAVDVRGKGLLVFSSCSHAGICNVALDASRRFQRPIYAIIGGLHLAGPEMANRIPPTVQFLQNNISPPPVYVIPLHCTGHGAKVALANAFGEGCVPGGVGMKARIESSTES
ncbi:hypothetical protein CPB86DRAFT_484584 [Serendipita vermifera]|nr:hypothetical protein CPB86DRAFT_484584 [Serendipita vermifera]